MIMLGFAKRSMKHVLYQHIVWSRLISKKKNSPLDVSLCLLTELFVYENAFNWNALNVAYCLWNRWTQETKFWNREKGACENLAGLTEQHDSSRRGLILIFLLRYSKWHRVDYVLHPRIQESNKSKSKVFPKKTICFMLKIKRDTCSLHWNLFS